MTSGQVFRWDLIGDRCWLGVDGEHWYRVQQLDSSLEILSNGTQASFEALFRLDWDASKIESDLLELAPELAPYLRATRGLRLMRPSCSTEIFFCFLCTPNNNLKRILQMSRHLASKGDAVAEIDGNIVYRFPSTQVIAEIDEAELRAKGFGYRAATIPLAAKQVLARGASWIEGLKSIPYEDAHRELCGLKGIGPKLADCIALFGLHQTEAIPIDTHIWQAYLRLYRPDLADRAMTDARYREASNFMRSRYRQHSGWAQQYLFYDNLINWRTRQK